MTVQELIERLKELPQDTQVYCEGEPFPVTRASFLLVTRVVHLHTDTPEGIQRPPEYEGAHVRDW